MILPRVLAASLLLLPALHAVRAAPCEVPDPLESVRGFDLPVALDFEGAPIRKVLHALEAATGASLRYGGDGDRKVLLKKSEPTDLRVALALLADQVSARWMVRRGGSLDLVPLPAGFALPRRIGAKSQVFRFHRPGCQESRLQGTVLLRVLVCADGSVGQILVLEGDRRLAECAVDAVSEWRYEPAHVGGEPVDAYLTLTLDFTL